MIGAIVKVTVDRPLGSSHPEYAELYYPVNYGYVQGILAADGEQQDAYVLGVDTPVKEFMGRVIGIIHREDDIEDKWGGAPEEMVFAKEEIAERVAFQERYFQSTIRME